MPSPQNAQFRTVDLDIVSKFDLSPIGDYLEDKAFVQYNGRMETGMYFLSFAPNISLKVSRTPEKYTVHLIKLIQSFPDDLLQLWFKSKSRVFDYGIDGAVAPPPYPIEPGRPIPVYRADLTPKTIQQLEKLKATIRITLYPFHPEPNPAFNPDPAATV